MDLESRGEEEGGGERAYFSSREREREREREHCDDAKTATTKTHPHFFSLSSKS
jgi:hypothetical protein